MRINLFKIFLFGIILLVQPSESIAQSYIGIQARGIYGFETNELRLDNDIVTLNQSVGYQAFLQYSYRIKKIKLEPKFGIGVKQLAFDFEVADEAIVGTTTKLSFLFGADYKFYSDWYAGLDFIIENNHDFEAFRVSNSDLFRYNLQLRVDYKLFKRFTVSAGYASVLYPRVAHFLMTNPSNQLSLGVAYKIFKL